jgi:hypothetical protein
MRIYVSNVSTVLTDAEVLDVLPAMRRQTYHVQEWWRTAVEQLIFDPTPVPDAWQIVIADDSDQAGALGYHDYTPNGRPISYVFAKTDQQYGYSWTVTLSHELVEMIADPWISALMQTGDARFHALELGDPVEADELGYLIHVIGHPPVLVSDFVTPNWFVPGSTGVFDHRGHCTEPLQILEGGYAYIWEGGWYAVDAEGKRSTAEELPERTRLKQYSRPRGQNPRTQTRRSGP